MTKQFVSDNIVVIMQTPILLFFGLLSHFNLFKPALDKNILSLIMVYAFSFFLFCFISEFV